MSADRDDFTGNLTLELPYVKPAEKPRQVGGLRATGWPLAYRDAEEQARWAVSPELPPHIRQMQKEGRSQQAQSLAVAVDD